MSHKCDQTGIYVEVKLYKLYLRQTRPADLNRNFKLRKELYKLLIHNQTRQLYQNRSFSYKKSHINSWFASKTRPDTHLWFIWNGSLYEFVSLLNSRKILRVPIIESTVRWCTSNRQVNSSDTNINYTERIQIMYSCITHS